MNLVLVTGASGSLGSELVKDLNKRRKPVVGIFNNNSELIYKVAKHIKCDIGDKRAASSLLEKLKSVGLIIHCASKTNVNWCEKNKKECFRTNVLGTRNIVELAKMTEAPIIYISTSSVFSGEEGNYKEDDTPDPKNFYSLSKLLGEEAVLSYDKGVVVRATPIGVHLKSRPQSNFIEWLVNSIKENKSFNLFNDVYINPVSFESLAKVLLKIPQVLKSGILHIGSKDKISKADIGKVIMKKFPKFSGKVKRISIDEIKDDTVASRPKKMLLNVRRAIDLGLKIPKIQDELKIILKGINQK